MNIIPPPKVLHKFRSWNDPRHRTLLTEGKLWVPLASDLNDPFDCRIPLRYDRASKSDNIVRFAKLIKEDMPDMPDVECKRLVEDEIDSKGLYDKTRAGNLLDEYAEVLRKSHAILSLCRNAKNPVLWSHYADQYRGFAVGFDTGALHRTIQQCSRQDGVSFTCTPVQYTNDFPCLQPPDAEENNIEYYIPIFATKSLAWTHEEEFRFVFLKEEAFALSFESDCVNCILLGPEMSEGDCSAISCIAAEKFPQAKLLQARRKTLSFELEFVPVE